VEWDDIVGKYVLIGLTYVDADGQVIRQEQEHGRIIEANENDVTVRLAGSNEETWLPPDLDAFEIAAEGEYTLRGTGEVISNPDLLGSWSISPEVGG